MSPDQDRRDAGVRWGWVLGCFLGGSLLIAAAFAAEARWQWQGVTPSVVVKIGTALGLAGVLFLLERRFTGTVVEVTARAAREVEGHLQERTA